VTKYTTAENKHEQLKLKPVWTPSTDSGLETEWAYSRRSSWVKKYKIRCTLQAYYRGTWLLQDHNSQTVWNIRITYNLPITMSFHTMP